MVQKNLNSFPLHFFWLGQEIKLAECIVKKNVTLPKERYGLCLSSLKIILNH